MIIQNITLTNVGNVNDILLDNTGLISSYDAATGISGTTFTDSVGGRNATIYNGATTTTYNGFPVLQLNSSSSQYFYYNGDWNTAGINWSQTTSPYAFSYEMWVYPFTSATSGALIGRWDSNSTFAATYNSCTHIGFTSSHIDITYRIGSGHSNYYQGPTWSAANTWYHIVGTYSYNTTTQMVTYLYVNTVATKVTPADQPLYGANYTYLVCGRPPGINVGDTNYWNGYIGLWRVYNTALPQTQVTNNFNALRWRFGV